MYEETTRTNHESHVLSFIDIISEQTPGGVMLTDNDRDIGQLILNTILCLSIDAFGTVTNIINIICFIKQGFKDPINVSLLGLAISDLGCLVPLMWANICMTPHMSTADLPFEPVEFQYLTGCWPHITFTRVSAWMTALITLERCLCVTAPLQVNTLVTPKRVAIIILALFIILIASVAPVYVVNKLEIKQKQGTNRTIIGIVFTENREGVEKTSLAINNVFIPFIAFLVIIICTTILVIKLKHNTKWRSKTTVNAQTDNVTSRNQKASKMVVMISVLFIACFVPIIMIFIAMTTEPEISINGRHRNLATILVQICFVLESINSSMNIFIYYYMSSKYRTTFRHLFFTDKDIDS